MTTAKQHLKKAISHHRGARDKVRDGAAKMAAEQETRLLREREIADAKAAGEKEGS